MNVTPQHKCIIRGLALSKYPKEIADAMGLATKTVEGHVANVARIFNVRPGDYSFWTRLAIGFGLVKKW